MSFLPRLCAILLVGLAVEAGAIAAQDPGRNDPGLRDRLDRKLTRLFETSGAPGLAVGVIRDGELVYGRGFGRAELGADRPITTESFFHMASVTKPFVATAVMQLVEQGRIALDSPVTRYLDYFTMRDGRYRDMTVRQMLNHTAGMPDVTDYAWDRPEHDDGALERWVRGLADSSLIFEPGTSWRYSNIAFEVMADVVAKVSGEPFETYVENHILEPVGMHNSTLMVRAAPPVLVTKVHVQRDGQAGVSDVFHYNRRHAGSSTLVSNISEMARWAAANLNRGTLDGRRILRDESYDVIWTPTTPAGTDRAVGLSWFIQERDGGPTVILHGGGDTGFRSFLAMVPDRSLAVVAMSNYDRFDVGNLLQVLLPMLVEGWRAQP